MDAVTIIIFIFQPAAKGPVSRLAGGLLFDKNKVVDRDRVTVGPAVTSKIGYEGNSRSVRRVLPKITSLHKVTAAGTPK